MTTTPIFPPTRHGLPLGLGGAPLGNMFAPVPPAQVDALFAAALADGCRSFDTAPHYGHGLSELRFGQMLRGQAPGGFALSSKVGRLLTPDSQAQRAQNGFVDGLPFNQHWDFSAQVVRRSVEDSLQRLGLAGMDTVFVHDCDAVNHGAHYSPVLQQVLHEALPELHAMRRQGLLRHIGLGVNDVQVCLDVLRGECPFPFRTYETDCPASWDLQFFHCNCNPTFEHIVLEQQAEFIMPDRTNKSGVNT